MAIRKDDNQPNTGEVEGEGSYTASKSYDDAAEKFAKSGEVDASARKASKALEDESEDLESAVEEGRSRSAGEDPLLYDKKSV